MGKSAGARAGIKYIKVPNKLLAKVRSGSGPSVEDIIGRAEKTVGRHASSYRERCRADITKLHKSYAALADEAAVERTHLQAIYDVAHELRGEAGMYGYALIGKIAKLLCDYLAALDNGAMADMRVVEAHVKALQVADAGNLTGSDSEASQAILSHLTELHKKVLS